MRRPLLNLLVDVLLLLGGAALAGTGLALAYRLPPGRANRDLLLWGWGRHQWGDAHLVLGWVVAGLALLHLLLHLGWTWRWCAEALGVRGSLRRRVLPAAFLLVAAALLVAAPWLLPRTRDDAPGARRHRDTLAPAPTETAP